MLYGSRFLLHSTLRNERGMVSIEVVNPREWTREVFGDNTGRVFLDVPEGFTVELSKALDQLAETQQISQ